MLIIWAKSYGLVRSLGTWLLNISKVPTRISQCVIIMWPGEVCRLDLPRYLGTFKW